MNITTVEECPTCKGTGEIQASELTIDDIESKISYFLNEQNEPQLTISVHPFIEAYLTKGFMSIVRKWVMKYKKRIKIKPEVSYHFLETHFFNKDGEEIKI